MGWHGKWSAPHSPVFVTLDRRLPDGRIYRLPPGDPMRAQRGLMALLLPGALLAVAMLWAMALIFYSPTAPGMAAGRTMLFSMPRSGVTVYVRPHELLISVLLCGAAFVVPGIYLACHALARRFRKKRS